VDADDATALVDLLDVVECFHDAAHRPVAVAVEDAQAHELGLGCDAADCVHAFQPVGDDVVFPARADALPGPSSRALGPFAGDDAGDVGAVSEFVDERGLSGRAGDEVPVLHAPTGEPEVPVRCEVSVRRDS
jgi:hypothetical protein